VGTKKPRRWKRPGLVGAELERGRSGFEGAVGFAVVGEVADAVHGVFG